VRAIKEGLQGSYDLRQEVGDIVSPWFAGLLRSKVTATLKDFEYSNASGMFFHVLKQPRQPRKPP
jgi:hypothetical protein